jgi:CARDB
MKLNLIVAALALTGITAAINAQPQIAKPIQNPQLQPVNPAILKVPLTLLRPDLTVMEIKPRMLHGSPYAYVCVKNSGPVAASAFDVELMMGAPAPTGSPPISWIQLVGTMRYPNVPANGGYTCNDFRLPGTSLPNCVKYTARADSRSEIAETNEGNNTRDHLGGCLGEPPIGASVPKFRVPDLTPITPLPGDPPSPRLGPRP